VIDSEPVQRFDAQAGLAIGAAIAKTPRKLNDSQFNATERGKTMTDSTHTKTWPDLAIALYDRLSGRNAEITYEFCNMHIQVPSGTGSEAEHAEWVMDGTLKIRTRDLADRPN